MRVNARIRSTGNFRRKADAIAREIEEAGKEAVLDTALAVEGGAKRRVPVRTGRLRNSIGHELADDKLSARVGTNVEYGPYVEFGTTRMHARPYLFPAAESERRGFAKRLKEALKRAIARGAQA